jgi:hypothetical protein
VIDQLPFLNDNFFYGDKYSVAIVFDACRYDLFNQYHEEYLTGELHEAWSPACHTYGWVRRSLMGHYPNITVIGGHPLFNSKGVPVHGWTATKHFSPENIIDVWDFGYSDDLGTIDPNIVVEAALEHADQEKLLIWFLQPHCPYVGRTKLTKFHPYARGDLNKDLQYWMTEQLEQGRITADYLWVVHRDNMLAAFEATKKLGEAFSDDVIITADHGELLGEDGKFFHPSNETENPILRTVPLFVGAIK